MKLFSLVIILTLNVSIAEANDIIQVRSQFHKAILNPESIESFYNQMAGFQTSDPVLLAYKATSEAFMAQEVWNPILKIQYLNNFHKLMNQAVSISPENLEIRFLRLAVEYHIPKLFQGNSHMDEDLTKIFSNTEMIKSLNFDKQFSRYILNFITDSKLCTKDQLNILRELIL